jgi:alpha/beta hydrolase fold
MGTLRVGMGSRCAIGMAFVGVLVAAGCGDDSGTASDTTAAPTSTASRVTTTAAATVETDVKTKSTFEGLVDVDGHDIYARCAGNGSPTIVYFTGWAPDKSKRGVAIAPGIENALGPEFRVCSYERRNTGRSESVEGTQSPEDVIADVDGFLAALDEDGPFVLLGASFGGLVSSAYAVTHPDRVAGMVLLDASTGVDYEIEEQHNFRGMCMEANRYNDANYSLEKLDNCSLAEWIHDHQDQEPDVPLLFLAAADSTDRGTDDDVLRQAWVESWSPGEWRVVDVPHWMDEADPRLVADAVREVIDLNS